jgi:Rod binding domain-containing protein
VIDALGKGELGRAMPDVARPDGLIGRQGDFAAVIARSKQSVDDTPEAKAAAAREGAQDFVAVTLVQPLLKQLRESNHAAPPFAPSSGELQFRAMMDAQISQRIVRASSFPIVDVVARNLMRGGKDAAEGVMG